MEVKEISTGIWTRYVYIQQEKTNTVLLDNFLVIKKYI